MHWNAVIALPSPFPLKKISKSQTDINASSLKTEPGPETC